MGHAACIEAINRALAPHNTELDLGLAVTFGSAPKMTAALVLPTRLVAKKRGQKPLRLLPLYCPFCGGKWEGR